MPRALAAVPANFDNIQSIWVKVGRNSSLQIFVAFRVVAKHGSCVSCCRMVVACRVVAKHGSCVSCCH